MKKKILGLFLTVGISSFALAGNFINKKEIDNLKQKNVIFIESKFVNKIDFEKIIDCYHAYYLKITDCDGRITTTNAGGNAGSCGGEQDGTIVFHVKSQKVCTPEAQLSMALQQLSEAFNF